MFIVVLFVVIYNNPETKEAKHILKKIRQWDQQQLITMSRNNKIYGIKEDKIKCLR